LHCCFGHKSEDIVSRRIVNNLKVCYKAYTAKTCRPFVG